MLRRPEQRRIQKQHKCVVPALLEPRGLRSRASCYRGSEGGSAWSRPPLLRPVVSWPTSAFFASPPPQTSSRLGLLPLRAPPSCKDTAQVGITPATTVNFIPAKRLYLRIRSHSQVVAPGLQFMNSTPSNPLHLEKVMPRRCPQILQITEFTPIGPLPTETPTA